ncbi:hypothetical protein AT15_03710 [Kosmotoga arenicorallina S304]|uniref:Uncharacterized protein n=1 Tax=Kosmotoga arenicorallina S304 TaxID=1453497 RepID=A0A176K4E7_9BACT|nr:DUF5696 domain-containing protein [Kosmotoga arenicorallina]OAA31942.1 hypothetical protein AT15_03710 [Kosmotoga arenicorallina S304]
MLANKKLLLILGVLIAFISTFANNTGIDYLSNRFTKPEKYEKVNSKFSIANYLKIAENEYIALFIDPKTTSIRVLDKRTGYVWGDVIEKEEAYLSLNKSWNAIAKSAVLIEYFNERGIMAVKGSADKNAKRNFQILPDGVSFQVTFEDIDISLNFSIKIDKDSLIFRLNSEDISEKDKFSLGSIVFVPFLGSVPEDELDGYIFIPDGPGALIRYSKSSNYSNWFEKRVYGEDYSIENLTVPNDLRAKRPNDFLREEPKVLIPVFGIVHGVKQNALFGVINSGKEYAAVVAYPSGVLTDYNRAGIKFIYRQKYLQPTSRSGTGVQVVQKKKNNFDAELQIFFLTGDDADYVGMARYYKENFADELFGKPETENKKKILPLGLTVIASDIEKKLIGYNTKSITNVEQIKTIARKLKEENIDNLKIFVEGWQAGGIHGNKVGKLSFESKVGGKKGLISLLENSFQENYEVCLVDNVVKVGEKQINVNREVGINLSQSSIYKERDNKDLWLYRFYYLNPSLSSKYILEKSEKLTEIGFKNLALQEYGRSLYGDMRINREITREETLFMIEETLNKASKTLDLYFFSPNSYAWKYTKGILDIPMNNSQYLFETDTVPFLQILLSGNIEYYVPFMNNSFFSKTSILKAIEYGASPSFLVTWVDNYVIKDTPLWDYPSTKFEDWFMEIKRIYEEMSEALSPVIGSKIVDRKVLESGVVKVDYENGNSIIVNYTDKPYLYEELIVQPQSFLNFERKSINSGDDDL